MLRFVSSVRINFAETLSIFYYSLHVWYHDNSTIFVIFRLRLLFIEFSDFSATRFCSCFANTMFEISGLALDTVSKQTQWQEYHFYSLFLDIRSTCSSNPKNYRKFIWLNKLTKYSKITQKCTKLQHRATGIVRQQYKKFGRQNQKKNNCLPSVIFWHSAYSRICRVLYFDTRHICWFAVC